MKARSEKRVNEPGILTHNYCETKKKVEMFFLHSSLIVNEIGNIFKSSSVELPFYVC